MNPFDRAIGFVLAKEGDYSNDSQDPGGETRYGISKRAYPTLDIPNITREQAVEIYRNDYWNKAKCNELPSPIAILLFDSAVNQGVTTAVKLLQISLHVAADGVIGPVTIAAAHRASVRGVVVEYVARRGFQYAMTKNVARFGLGWFRRLAECAQLSMEPL